MGTPGGPYGGGGQSHSSPFDQVVHVRQQSETPGSGGRAPQGGRGWFRLWMIPVAVVAVAGGVVAGAAVGRGTAPEGNSKDSVQADGTWRTEPLPSEQDLRRLVLGNSDFPSGFVKVDEDTDTPAVKADSPACEAAWNSLVRFRPTVKVSSEYKSETARVHTGVSGLPVDVAALYFTARTSTIAHCPKVGTATTQFTYTPLTRESFGDESACYSWTFTGSGAGVHSVVCYSRVVGKVWHYSYTGPAKGFNSADEEAYFTKSKSRWLQAK
ncbi:MAG: hypothetical protein HOQ24_16695 [Mycobacteriaceae bacterium]|nr:hypothetical protein [Mycobacteriaceae bacterium]